MYHQIRIAIHLWKSQNQCIFLHWSEGEKLALKKYWKIGNWTIAIGIQCLQQIKNLVTNAWHNLLLNSVPFWFSSIPGLRTRIHNWNNQAIEISLSFQMSHDMCIKPVFRIVILLQCWTFLLLIEIINYFWFSISLLLFISLKLHILFQMLSFLVNNFTCTFDWSNSIKIDLCSPCEQYKILLIFHAFWDIFLLKWHCLYFNYIFSNPQISSIKYLFIVNTLDSPPFYTISDITIGSMPTFWKLSLKKNTTTSLKVC